MRVIEGRSQRRSFVSTASLLAALAIITVTVFFDTRGFGMPAVAIALVVAAAAYGPLIQWRFVLAALLAVILFIPIRRYTMPGNLPFELEPYRLLVALVLGAWVLSLLADPRVRFHRTTFEGPLFLILLAAIGSVLVNEARVDALQTNVIKSLTFFASFLLVLYLVVSLVRRIEDVNFLVRVLVSGGAVLAVLAIIEARIGFNPFDHLTSFVPILRLVADEDLLRGGQTRAFGSAEHPIALGAALVLLAPLAFYLAKATHQRRWWLALIILIMGALATFSRTGVVMFAIGALVFLWLRPIQTWRMWPLVVALLVIVHFAMPGTLGTFRVSFFPEEGLIAEQRSQEGSCTSAGRVADLGPALDEASQKPFVGSGYGTRLVTGEETNACILDNQWLGTLLETGLLGVLGWLALFWSFIRRAGRAAKADPSPTGWLYVALAASVAAFAVGMFTFDAFSFIQVTFLLFVLLGLGAALLSSQESPAVQRSAAPVAASARSG